MFILWFWLHKTKSNSKHVEVMQRYECISLCISHHFEIWFALKNTFSCCLRKTTDCFHETTDCFTSGTFEQRCYEALCMITVVSFLSKPIVGQKCIYCASESDNKEIYSLLSLKFKGFYEWQPHWWSWGWWIFVNVSLERLEGLLLT